MSLFTSSLWCPSSASAEVLPTVNYLFTDDGLDVLTSDDGLTLLTED